jgi:16S rRNA (adenine1518-N6/adenine1519-N6)-dimethyltransferase
MNPDDRLIIPKNTVRILQKYDFHFSKKLGQNFLIDDHVMDRIIKGAGISRDDCALEIGPGIGTMTQFLGENAGKVIAVELDKKLIPILEDTLSEFDNITVINDDILKTDITALAKEYNGGRPMKVVANLPYYITTPIIMELLEKRAPIESLTVMVQKEVALRMQAKPGSKDYGALSLAVQYYSHPYIVANVPSNCFMPRPNVDSAVIRLDIKNRPDESVKDERFMFAIIKAAFAQRRKTLVNAVSSVGELGIGKEKITEALLSIGKSASVRGETFSVAEFALLSDELYQR